MLKSEISFVLFVATIGISLLYSCQKPPQQETAPHSIELDGKEGISIELFHVEKQSKAGASVVDLWLPRQQPLCDSVYSWFMEVDPTFTRSVNKYTPEGLNAIVDEVFNSYPGVGDDAFEAHLNCLYEDDTFVTFIHGSIWGWSPFGDSTIHGATFRKSDGRHLRYMDYFKNADGMKAYLSPYNTVKWDNSDFVQDSVYAAYDAPFPQQDIWSDNDSICFVWPRYALGYGVDGNLVKSISKDKAAEFMAPEGLSFLKLTTPKISSCRSLPKHFNYKTFHYDLIGMDIEVPDFMTLRSTEVDSTIVFAFNDYNYMLITLYPADWTETCSDINEPSETFYQESKENWRVSSNYSSVYSINDQLIYQKEIWRRDSSLVRFALHYETANRKPFDDVIKRMLKPLR